ncbi:kinase-like domain-containing protein [Mycena pura]|uniref:Kinase-like domain-containing protein n=1 Tax=Mycena pura TaxID=153505 RepID=A0AAD6VKW3_9AGAR|nr:kinase-like domain-containing protein [Mycena pura]
MSLASSISTPPRAWGYLRPVGSDVEAIGLSGVVIAIGRTTRGYIEREDQASVQYVVLNGPAVSNIHSVIHWNGREGAASIVTLTDYSMNGTFVDGFKVGPRNVHHLYNGSIVCFGCKVPILGQTDFRYIFHHAFGRSKTESVLTHYELLDCVGSGAFGVVHRAIEKKSGKVFAIKTAFRTMTMMVLEHENICKLQEVFFRLDGEVVDIVLEYVDGVGLHRLGSFAGRLTEHHVREIAHQVCTAISYMHGKGVLHGDLKPNNILLTRAHPWTIKVIDFGLARVVGNINLQRVSAHIYTAPEAQLQQLRLENPPGALTHLWDSWGIGCILFNLHSFSHPFVRESERKDSNEDEGPFEVGIDYILWHLLDHLSTNARDLVRRLLAVDPHERMTVAAALHHPWLAGYEPYNVSFADVSFLPPSPASRIIPLEETVADSDTERDEMDVDVRQVPASKAKRRRRQAQPQGGQRRASTRVKKASRPDKTPGDERHVKAGPGALTRRSKRR